MCRVGRKVVELEGRVSGRKEGCRVGRKGVSGRKERCRVRVFAAKNLAANSREKNEIFS